MGLYAQHRGSRFHPLLVVLHWLLALLIVGLLCVGFFLPAAVPNTDPLKPGILMGHMAGGMVELAALFHQFLRKDGLLRRMWFAQRA